MQLLWSLETKQRCQSETKVYWEISKILEEFERKVQINFSKTRLKLVMGNIKVVSKLINSSFPDYESVIPKDNNKTMIVDCKSFSETIDRVSTISYGKERPAVVGSNDGAWAQNRRSVTIVN